MVLRKAAGPSFRIVRGRHRVVASMIAGRDWVVAELDDGEDKPWLS